MPELVAATPNLRRLPGDELAQFGGDALTVIGGAKCCQLSRPIEGKIERAKADQESEPLDVRRGLPPVAVLRMTER